MPISRITSSFFFSSLAVTSFFCLSLGELEALFAQEWTPQEITPASRADAGTDPRIAILRGEHGLSADEAQEQLRQTDRFEKQIDTLVKTFPDAYLKTLYQYGRPFRIDVVFSRDVAAIELQQAVPAEIRPIVKVQRSRFTRDQIMAGKRRLMDVLSPALNAVGVAFDFQRDRYVVRVEALEEQAARRLVPSDLRNTVEFARSPGTNSAGVHTEADDATHPDKTAVWGGWPLLNSSKAAVCTGGFIAKDKNSQSWHMLTAGHCPTTTLQFRWSDATYKTLGSVLYRGDGGNYDLQTRWGAFLNSSGYFWIDHDVSGSYRYNCDVAGNNCSTKNWRNLNTGVGSTGYVAVVDAVKGNYWSQFGWNDNHPVNSFVCNYGMRTGTTCGRVVESEYDYDGKDGTKYTNMVHVRLDNSWGAAIAQGDSGGPVFKINSTSSTFAQATAVGLTSGGSFNTIGTLTNSGRPCSYSTDPEGCFLIYMPIDRINDRQPLAIASANSPTPIEVD